MNWPCRFFYVLAVMVLACSIPADRTWATTYTAEHGASLLPKRQQLDDLERMVNLSEAGEYVADSSSCRRHVEEIGTGRQRVEQLAESYRRSPSEQLRSEWRATRERLDRAVADYRRCFAAGFDEYRRAHPHALFREFDIALDYDAFNRRYGVYTERFGSIDAARRLKGDVEAELDRAKAATVVRIFDQVEIKRAGDSQWRRIERQGERMLIGDDFRTGPSGRARIEFADRYQQANAGPSVVNVGSSSEIWIEAFVVSFTDPLKREGIIGMIRGTIRAFMKNWGPRSAFSVRTGTSLCGIRGSDVAIEYDGRGGATYYVDHGSVTVEAGRASAAPSPGYKVEVRGDRLGEPVPMDPADWSRMLWLTNPGDEVPL